MKYKIRTAVPGDEGRIRELFVEMLQTIYDTDDVKGYGDGDLDRFWDRSRDRIYVAEDGQVVAYLSVEVHSDPVDHIYLDDFSVTAAYRSKGIGSELIRAAEAYAEELGIAAVLLHVEKSNQSAMRFYERLGYSLFRDDGHRYLLKKEALHPDKAKKAIRLETERLILRDYNENDFDAYYRLKTDDRTMYYLQDIRLKSIDAGKADFADVLDDMKQTNRKYYFLHMELKDSHEQVGSIGYTVTDESPAGKMVHLGYFTYPRFWGNGYTSEALQKVLEYAFTVDNVYRVKTGCLAENIGSERVMQKNGMIREAEYPDYEWHDGKMKTRLEYRLLKTEWEKGKDTANRKNINRQKNA